MNDRAIIAAALRWHTTRDQRLVIVAEKRRVDDLTIFIDHQGGELVTDLRAVVMAFGKRHDNILQLFQTRILGKHSQEFTELNFQVSEYIDSTGRKVPELLMTKDGFMAIATKLRGAELWQERFIAAFNAMSELMYRMTQKGLTELAMSFTGDPARVVRIRFLNAFEAVAERLARAEQTIAGMLHDLERASLRALAKLCAQMRIDLGDADDASVLLPRLANRSTVIEDGVCVTV